jgi:hypothetical protein
MTENRTAGGKQTPADRRKQADIRELLFNVTTLFNARVNLLLVAQSIFFAAIANLWGNEDMAIKLIVCGLGVIMTIMFWLANTALSARSNHLTEELKKVDAVYKGYMEVGQPFVTWMLAHVLPFFMLVAWSLVIYLIVASPILPPLKLGK